MDEFKKYIQQHKDNLDLDEPRPVVWNGIVEEMEGGVKIVKEVKKAGLGSWVRYAVAACVLLLAGFGLKYVLKDDAHLTPIAVITPLKKEAPISNIPSETKKEKTILATTEVKNSRPKKDIATQNLPYTPYISMEERNTLQNLETSFTQVINLQKDKLSSMPMYAESPDYFLDFKQQIKQIEKDEKEIKMDITKKGMSDELLEHLINLYQQKLSVLKQLQIEMNKTNNRYQLNRGPVDSAKTYFLNL